MTMCRTCLKTPADKNMTELKIDVEGNDKGYREIVLFCLDIKVVQGSNITTNLCEKCYTKIISFYKFKVLSLKNDAYLNSMDPMENNTSVFSDEHEIKQENLQDSDDFGPSLVEGCDLEVKFEVDCNNEDNLYLGSDEELPVQNVKYEYVEEEIHLASGETVENKLNFELGDNVDVEMNSVLGDSRFKKRRKKLGVTENENKCNAKMSSSENSTLDLLTLTEIGETTQSIGHVLPLKSQAKYRKAYKHFISWKNDRKDKSLSESLLTTYFNELSKSLKPSTLWGIYSMLKATIKNEHDINIKEYSELTTLLKRLSNGFRSTKSKVLTPENIQTFLRDAPDKTYLVAKVVLIFGISGSCTTTELVQLKTSDIEEHNNMLLININTRTKLEQAFVIRGEHLDIVNKYRKLRPENTIRENDRFFLNYGNGKCTKQVIGRHRLATIPKIIATYLKLPNPECYTGHCFRRTSATFLADSGANYTTLKRHGGWDLDKEESHPEGSVANEFKMKEAINVYDNSFVSTDATVSRPSTSNEDFLELTSPQ